VTHRRYPPLQQSHAPASAKAGAGRVWGRVYGGWRAVPLAVAALAGRVERRQARGWRAGLAAAVASVAGPLLVASGVSAGSGPPGIAHPPYRDGPPPGFSGGFGEDTCQGCHFEPGVEVNEPGGTLTLKGVPERFEPGTVYPIVVTLTRPEMQVGGFELTARFEDGGAQAGALAPGAGAEEKVGVTTDRDVQYAHQRLAGSALVAPDTARWVVLWTAPAEGGAVVFNVAANAANGDDSSSGDFVYAAEVRAAGGNGIVSAGAGGR
jgi:hypothetical protein